MHCPLGVQKPRAEVLNRAEEEAPRLPSINGGDMGEPEAGRNIFGDPFKRAKSNGPAEKKEMAVPGPKQAAAAERLMKGFSSFRHQSAPSSLGGGLAGQLAARPGQPQYQLSSTVEEGECAVRLASAVAYAKQWRRRVEDSRHKRFNSTVVRGRGEAGG